MMIIIIYAYTYIQLDMFLCIHTNKMHTVIKHTTEQIKKTINAICQFVVRNEIDFSEIKSFN